VAVTDTSKYQPAELPNTKIEAEQMAELREAWAAEARTRDRPGTAREFELTAKLLRFLAEHLER
jgi:hypothetical protein